MADPLDQSLRPAEVCRQLLAAMDASEGRRKRRKRDTTPDAIGMAVKRRLLDETIVQDPDPDGFEAWLLQHTLAAEGSGPVRAMAREIFADWGLAQASDVFRSWLLQGAPSDDADRAG
jgi:hypothetical protein